VETKEKTLLETGFAWAILDSETKRNIVSYVDPGKHPSHKENWLAFVNNANYERDLNIKATQFKNSKAKYSTESVGRFIQEKNS